MKLSNFPFPTLRPSEGTVPTLHLSQSATLTNKQAETIQHQLRVQEFEAQGIRVLHVFNKRRPNGGFTVAYRPCSNFNNSKMVECAVSTCSAEDTFNKRIGAQLALDNFANGRTIDLPILAVYTANDITFAIKACFIAIHNAVGPGYITPH